MKNGKKIADQKHVNNKFDFYNNLFKSDNRNSKYDIAQFLSLIQIPRLAEEQFAKCKTLISGDELICALKNMPKNKSLVNDCLTKNCIKHSGINSKYHSLLVLENHFLKRSQVILKNKR